MDVCTYGVRWTGTHHTHMRWPPPPHLIYKNARCIPIRLMHSLPLPQSLAVCPAAKGVLACLPACQPVSEYLCVCVSVCRVDAAHMNGWTTTHRSLPSIHPSLSPPPPVQASCEPVWAKLSQQVSTYIHTHNMYDRSPRAVAATDQSQNRISPDDSCHVIVMSCDDG